MSEQTITETPAVSTTAPETVVIGAPVAATDTATTAPAATDPPKTETKVEPSPKAREFAALARRDKEVRAREQAIKARESEIAQVTELRAKIKANPASVLETYGIGIEDIINGVLGEEAPAQTAEQQVAALREQLAAEKAEQQKAASDAETKRIEQGLNSLKSRLSEAAAAAPDTFELTLAEGQAGVDLALEVMQQIFDRDGVALTMEQALSHVEKHLEEQAAKVFSFKRFQSRVAPQQSTPAGNSTSAPKTLTNSLGSQVAPKTVAPGKWQNNDELLNAAVAALRQARAAAQ